MSNTVLGYQSKGFHDNAVSDYRSGADGDDTADVDTAVAGASVKSCAGKASIAVSAEFSGAEGTTVDVTVLLHDDAGECFALSDKQTLTAVRFTKSSKPMALATPFDTFGAPQYSVRIDNPSTGTVDLRTWAY